QFYRQQVLAQDQQAQTGQKVRGLLERSRGLLDEGWSAADPAKVAQASALASQADDLALGDEVGAALRQDAAAARDHAAKKLQRLRKDRALLEALQEVQVAYQPFELVYDKAIWSIVLTPSGVDDEYARAFRAWGLDVDGTAEDEAVARLGAEPGPVVQEVIAALDGWMLLRLRKRPGADWRRLYRLAERLDTSPRRQQLRALVVHEAPPSAAGVAGLVGMGSPWPIPLELVKGSPWRSLLEMRKDLDLRTEAVPTLVLFSYACADVGDFATAVQVLRPAVVARPQEAPLLVALAVLLERQGHSRMTEAVSYYRAAFSRSRHPGVGLARALVQDDKPGEAEELLRELARQPSFEHNPYVLFYLGVALNRQQRYSEAEKALRACLDLRPNWASAFANLGSVLNSQKKYGPAEAACRKAIALEPDSEWGYIVLGHVYIRQGHYEQAEASGRKATALNPHSAQAWQCLGTALHLQKKHGEADMALRKAIALEPGDFLAHYNLGTNLVAQSRHREAEAVLRKAVALKPEDAETHNNLGASLMDQKKYEEAETAYRKAIALKPDHGLAYRSLGYVLMHQTRFQEAVTELQKVGDFFPANSPVRQQAQELQRLCGRYSALDAKFADLLSGAVQPANALEQLYVSHLCQFKKHYAASARFAQAAFAAQPKLTANTKRYDAAGAAALAGCGRGLDAAKLTDEERAGWRRQALAWLRQDLAKWGAVLQRANAKTRARIQQELQYWQADEDLAGLREPDALAKLPPDEREDCRALWQEVADLLRRAEE
ncbi:MAG: tetratricopeptide repeat protein, partial [Chloroflexi bacterium]|nr:tetratricopeptide repeat protein [Chloroflexota bacterium]